MMSTKSRYALHLILELTMQEPGVNLLVNSVAEVYGISEKYLEQIISVLVRGSFIKNVRGARSGYHLVNDMENLYCWYDFAPCGTRYCSCFCLDGDVNQCIRCKECVTLDLCVQVDRAISYVVDPITFVDLVEK